MLRGSLIHTKTTASTKLRLGTTYHFVGYCFWTAAYSTYHFAQIPSGSDRLLGFHKIVSQLSCSHLPKKWEMVGEIPNTRPAYFDLWHRTTMWIYLR